MKTFLIILAILWLVYRLTPLNNMVNEFFNLKGTLLDTSDSRLADISSEEVNYVDEEFNTTLSAKHALITFIPVVILIGIVLAL